MQNILRNYYQKGSMLKNNLIKILVLLLFVVTSKVSAQEFTEEHNSEEKDIKVVLLAQPPVLLSNPGKLFNCERFKLSCEVNEGFKESYPAYNESINKIALKYQVKFFDPYDLVSDKFQLYHNDRLNYFDDDHLSIYGNMWLFESYKGATFSTAFNL